MDNLLRAPSDVIIYMVHSWSPLACGISVSLYIDGFGACVAFSLVDRAISRTLRP